MSIYLLNDQPSFSDPNEAETDGLIAIGGDLSIDRLLNAYTSGIFPWFMENELIYWFSPDPRLVLFPDKFKIPSTLSRKIKNNNYEVRFDTDFKNVILQCSKMKRKHEEGTWINKDFIEGYANLYKEGFAHSVEIFINEKLVGGLYGLSLGKAFFGESMFHVMPDASKLALYHLVEKALKWGFHFIDCQVVTEHLIKLGAEPVTRKKYLSMLQLALQEETHKGRWNR